VTWKQSLADNRVAAEPTSRTGIKDLRAVVHRKLADAQIRGLSDDGRFSHAQTIAITGRSYRLKDHATVAGKEDKNKKIKSKSNEPSTAEPAS
jgi:hypothetical protein